MKFIILCELLTSLMATVVAGSDVDLESAHLRGQAASSSDVLFSGKHSIRSLDTVTCNDNNFCTIDTQLANGTCTFATVDPAVYCNDNNPNTIDSCDVSSGCMNTCNDTNACTIDTKLANGTCTFAAVDPAVYCNDANSLTIDTCDSSIGCVHSCDDNNACTREAFVNGVCQYVDEQGNPLEADSSVFIACDDNDPNTMDVCIPSTGCQYIKFSDYVTADLTDTLPQLDALLAQIENEGGVIYEEQTTLSDDQVQKIIDWIKLEVTQLRTPFCWRRSYGRGAGYPLTDCPSPKEKLGALCYTPCNTYDNTPGYPGTYSRQGTFDCQQECKSGWRDDGLFCRLAEYGRGGGYAWQFGDPLNDSAMYSRCEADHGRGNCEKSGLIVYPKCIPGYYAFGCCICRPYSFDCNNEGYTYPQIDLSCAVRIKTGDPTPLICRSGLEQDGALCYDQCTQGYDGIGPVCWQECDTDQTNCGAGCAHTEADCALAVVDQVLAPIIVAANILTLGVTSSATVAVEGAKDAVTIGSKSYQISSKVGRGFLWVANKLQTIKPSATAKGSNVVTKIRWGTTKAKLTTTGKVAGEIYGAYSLMKRQFAQDFVSQTSQEIADTVRKNLATADASYIERFWGEVMYREMAEAEGWNTASLVLGVVSIVDITGITGLVAAYAKPVCLEIFKFPVCTTSTCTVYDNRPTVNNPPVAVCKDVIVFTTTNQTCQATVDPITVDGGSFDPNRDKVFLSLSPPGPFAISASPSNVIMTATDSYNAASSCNAKITVTDVTPANVVCPKDKSQATDPSQCSAHVDYAMPVVTNNCVSTSTLSQTGGSPPGAVFNHGLTINTFVTLDSLGNKNGCSFSISVFDNEKPVISCAGLESIRQTDPGICTSKYNYQAPVGTDNCWASTVLSGGNTNGFDPYTFPLGASVREYTSTDMDGNSNSCSFDVTVLDKELPVIACPSNKVVGTDPGVCTTLVAYPTQIPMGTDNCPNSVTTQTSVLGSGSIFPIDTSTVSYKVTDSSGNNASCNFTVRVVDVEAPVAKCIPGVNPDGTQPKSNNPDGFFTIVGTDNCQAQKPGIKAYVYDSGSGTRFPLKNTAYYKLGMNFKYTVAKGATPTESPGEGSVNWKLKGKGPAYVIIVDEAGNPSLQASCFMK